MGEETLKTNGRHVGSRSVREAMLGHRPRVSVCGHIHEARGVETLGNTLVVNAGTAAESCFAWIRLGGKTRCGTA